jgi:hypothetical protein
VLIPVTHEECAAFANARAGACAVSRSSQETTIRLGDSFTTGRPRLGHVTEAARLVVTDGKMLVKQQQPTECAHLALAIERGAIHIEQRVRLAGFDFRNDLNDPTIEVARHLP